MSEQDETPAPGGAVEAQAGLASAEAAVPDGEPGTDTEQEEEEGEG
jgi:hypothetical protein